MDGFLESETASGKIKALMGSQDVSQKELAAYLGVTDETIRNRLAANRWDVKDLIRIAKKFGIDPGHFMRGKG